MERINTGLHNFNLINSLNIVEEKFIKCSISLMNEENYLLIEAIAQLASLHVRYRKSFKKHAFLLKVIFFKKFTEESINGKIIIKCYRTLSSDKTCVYSAKAIKDGILLAKGDFMISITDYG